MKNNNRIRKRWDWLTGRQLISPVFCCQNLGLVAVKQLDLVAVKQLDLVAVSLLLKEVLLKEVYLKISHVFQTHDTKTKSIILINQNWIQTQLDTNINRIQSPISLQIA